MIQKTLAQVARETLVTIDDGIARESGDATVPVQVKWYELHIVHNPTAGAMTIYGKATDGEWYVDWGYGLGYERLSAPNA